MAFNKETLGLRIGEICGLRWEDVDLKGSVIHVRQQLIYKNLGEGQKYYIHPMTICRGNS